MRMVGTWRNRRTAKCQTANLFGYIPDLIRQGSNPCLIERKQLLDENLICFGFGWQFDSFSGVLLPVISQKLLDRV